MRTESAEKTQCFDQVGFALAIRSNNERWPWNKFECELSVITKVLELDVSYAHRGKA